MSPEDKAKMYRQEREMEKFDSMAILIWLAIIFLVVAFWWPLFVVVFNYWFGG